MLLASRCGEGSDARDGDGKGGSEIGEGIYHHRFPEH